MSPKSLLPVLFLLCGCSGLPDKPVSQQQVRKPVTENMSAEQLIDNLNSGALDGDFSDDYWSSEVIDRIVRYIEHGHLNDRQAWNALGRIYKTADGEYGIMGYYTVYALASSSIPLKQWYEFINSFSHQYSSYQDLKQDMIRHYRQPAWARVIDSRTKQVIGGPPTRAELAHAMKNRQIAQFFEDDKRSL